MSEGFFSESRLRRWRQIPERLGLSWRRSLQFRAVTITLMLSGLAIIISSGYMTISIGSDLFQSRAAQAQADSRRALDTAQRIFDSSTAETQVDLQAIMETARNEIAQASESRLIAGFRVPGQGFSSVAPQDFVSAGLQGDAISEELRTAVQKNAEGLWWQSTALNVGAEHAAPGVIVGSQILLPEGSHYELYIGYDLSDTEETLRFVQRSLVIGGLVLLLLVGGVAWIVVRMVADPVRVVAETSAKLAAGDLEVRIPVRGEDELATLARSFNRMAESMQGQISELADLSQVQQRFVSDVSHELRTPLTTIRLAGDVLYDQRDTFPPATGRTAELLHTQTERFELLLADLLEISRYDAGSVQLALEPTNLVHLAEDCVLGMEQLAEQKGSELRILAPGGHSAIEIDPRRIRRIVNNLVGNAIEHGEGRPIVVAVDSTADTVALTVRDYGLGMSEDDAARAFDRFWRADPSRRRTIGGTGLGLAIALEDAQLHGGTLEVWSEPGRGSCFRLLLPRHSTRPYGRSPLPLPPDDAGAEGPGDSGQQILKEGDTP
ncbi:MtrAB system histidine kinase MtrB [Mycetocola spongiae]|uniref:MtrAB system histidine kinase MtrB n=1 Tax=Mycetocola spongiae TaxID=2859226 RepID=UPI001CF2AE92|nr:MtrAB system histidine kinase MtrB [Mycetocola spongiae]UCR90303.1 HAMP domain-containing histidine kinase [Mycetocola spongiae]